MNPPLLSMKPGDVRTGRPRLMSMARALALSGGPFDQASWPDKNLHTSIEAATDAGLSTVVVSGTQWEGHLVGLLVETAGASWFDGGRLDIKLPRSVKIGETLYPKLRLESVSTADGRETAAFSVWCENQSGDQVLVGTAVCPMPIAGEDE